MKTGALFGGAYKAISIALSSGVGSDITITPGTYPAFQYAPGTTVDFRDSSGNSAYRITPDSQGVGVLLTPAFVINDGPTMPSLGSNPGSGSIEILCTSGRFQPVIRDFSAFGGVDAINFRILQGGFFATQYEFKLDAATLSANRGWKFPNANPVAGNVPRFNDTAGTIAYSTGFTIDSSGNVTAASYRISALNTAPASATATGSVGQIRYDANFIYVCTATNTWKRTAISTW